MVERGVYIILNKVTGTRYIGGTGRGFKFRKCIHFSELRCNRHKNARLQADWSQYGEEAFEFLPVEIVPDKADVQAREQWWLDIFWGSDLYNVGREAAAPTKGRPHPHRGQPNNVSEDGRRRQSEAARNRVISAETRQKMSAAKRGRPMAEETKEKLRGQKRSEESRQKMRVSRQRQAPPFKGHTHSEEARERMAEASRQYWAQRKQQQALDEPMDQAA